MVTMYAAAVFYGLKLIVSHDKSDHVFLVVVAFITFTIISFTLMANFLDLAENNRFRFTVDPLALLLFGRLLQNSVLGWVKR
jgi:undecaprenyl pyrophosphate phosphatase UppP